MAGEPESMRPRKFVSSRALSLPEVLFVVAIIMILAAILLAAFFHIRDQALTAACEVNEQNLAAAIEAYAADHGGQYPTANGPITLAMFGGPGNPYVDPSSLVDPADGSPYQYVFGNGDCESSVASFQIYDLGGHNDLTLRPLPHIVQNADSVAYCAGIGLVADNGMSASVNNGGPAP
jgi:type II secretory pathway pseudopilin PulG